MSPIVSHMFLTWVAKYKYKKSWYRYICSYRYRCRYRYRYGYRYTGTGAEGT